MIANLLIGDLVAKLCLTFVTPWNVAHQATFCGILQTGILEWVAMPSSRGSSQPRDRTQVSCIANSLTAEPQGRSLRVCIRSRFSHVRLFVTLWPITHQAPLSVGFPSTS